MENAPKRSSTYDMLKRLDKKVTQTKTQRKDDSYSRNVSEYRKRRSVSPRNRESRKRLSVSPRRQDYSKRSKKDEIDDVDHDIPDRSFGDLYCKACDAHMNSDQMWDAHIQGKRHLKNIKKGEQGEMKYEILDEDPFLLPEIQKSTESIIGLQHCCEIRRLEGKQPTYHCFLCSSNVPNGRSLIDHVVGLKHRMAYLKEHDPVKHDLIDKTNLKKGMIEPVVAECIRLHQDKHGTGRMQVKLDKSKPPEPSNKIYRKPVQDVFDDDMKRDDRYVNDSSRDDRRSNFSENYKYKNYERPHYPDDLYHDRYLEKNMIGYPPYNDSEYPPMGRRSPIVYEHSHSASNQTSTWLSPEPPRDEPKRLQQNSSSNLFQTILKIIETMPSMLFLELVFHRVENLKNPTESELSMLQKIGNHMISIVMNQKLQKLSPDLLGKYQSNSNHDFSSMKEQKAESTNNLSSLMSLVSQFNNSKASSSTFNWGDQQQSADAPAFMTQNSFHQPWSGSSSTEIPGLTLSSTTEQDDFRQPPSWSSTYNYNP